MTWRIARRLTAESDKRGDDFLRAREAWNRTRSEKQRQTCIECARTYEQALELEIEHLESLEVSEDQKFALHRANIYKRLLARQLTRIRSAGAK